MRSGRALLGRTRLLVRAKLPPVAVDAVLTAALLFATAGLAHRDLAGSPSLVVFQWLLLIPLVWRRRAPLAVFGVMAAVAFLQWLVGAALPADVALLIALYTVAAQSSRRRTLLAVAVLELGTLLAASTWATHGRTTQSFVALSAMVIAAAVTGVNMRTRRAYLAALEDRAGRLERERDQRAQLAVAGERARIAREMHDIVTHNLSVMVALADGAVFAQERHPQKAAAAMRQVSATGRQAITDMRRFLGVLRADEPDALRHPMPGIAQLEPLAEQVRAAGLPTRLSVGGDPTVANAAAQLTVYRLVQEALTNTLKHAPAGTRAEVRVRCSPASLHVDVTDDGPATTAPGPPSGHGIAGMRERAAAYGGQLDAGPLPDGGWRVSAELTLIPRQDANAPQDGPALRDPLRDRPRAGDGAL
ncbi:sensor histidine kinase [Streptomyces sp. SPB162]|uniref:sensor histidine kinase n=1 Tax=Streptomyces sp. SPB162 TaxID=2940560 RepID=UPI0024064B92|nr:sensor histidine kinase [Streptomyces sp. SPB162]MDF9816013.1 signal transduction histidine kinase [Streptomyces sp. SPB162]